MKKKSWRIWVALMVLLLAAMLALLLYLLGRSGKEEQEYETQLTVYENVKPDFSDRKQVDYLSECRKVNPDTVAWVRIPDTEIDFPVVQGQDNAWYLNHNFEQEYSSLGVPFLDYRCAGDFTDFLSIIYGHHIKGGMMFSGLDDYKQADYFQAHKQGVLITEKKKYTIHFVACLVTESDSFAYNIAFPTDKEKTDYLEQAEEQALVLNDFSTDTLKEKQLILLSTCSYEFEEARTVVIGYLEEQEMQ